MTDAAGPRIAEAAEWRLLSLLFECPNARWREQVSDLGCQVADPLLRTAAEKALEEADEGLYHSSFGPGGPAAPREASYSDSVELGYLFSEIEAFYEAFAYRPVTQEAPDHVGVEAGFVAFLLLKQAFADAAGDCESAAIAEQARGLFLREHLSWVAEPLAARLATSSLEYLALAGKAPSERVGPSRERRAMPSVLPVIPSDSDFGCGDGAAT